MAVSFSIQLQRTENLSISDVAVVQLTALYDMPKTI